MAVRFNWLMFTFAAQIVMFVTFIFAFFTMEQHRQSEISDLQAELSKTRADHLRSNRQLLGCTRSLASARARSPEFGLEEEGDDLEEELEGGGPAAESAPQLAAGPSPVGSSPKAAPRAQLGANCVRKADKWWTYEVCLGEHVRQLHESSHESRPEEYLIGKFASTGVGTKQKYTDGDLCESPENRFDKRRAEVSLRCRAEATELRLLSFAEPSPCVYTLEVEVAASSKWCKDVGMASAAAAAAVAIASPPPSATAPTVNALAALPAAGGDAVAQKRDAVVAALRHSWSGYTKFAWGADELKPLSRKPHDWVGLGLTILDSLDVLWMAGLKAEFAQGVEWVRSSLTFDKARSISFFETTIRCLGGLLAAYELSGEQVLIEKSRDLGDRLLKAFTTPSGMPYTTISLSTGAHTIPAWTRGNLLLAEVGTVQLEFFALAQHTKERKFSEAALKVFAILDKEGPPLDARGGRLWPIHVQPQSGKSVGSTISFGAMGDSFYEYLLKLWLHTGKIEERYKRMYLESIKGLQERLVVEVDGLTYVAEENGGRRVMKMDHLVCFLPGTIALGAQHIPEVHDEHLALAKKLMATCYEMYARQRSGVAPEFVRFQEGRGMQVGAGHNLLRPETVESLFYLWRFTKDPIYREWGWKIFLAFERNCRVESGGYAGLKDVNSPTLRYDDTMQSFWVAETLKYLLLLFSDDALLDLSTHVINTEAHPLRSTWHLASGAA